MTRYRWQGAGILGALPSGRFACVVGQGLQAFAQCLGRLACYQQGQQLARQRRFPCWRVADHFFYALLVPPGCICSLVGFRRHFYLFESAVRLAGA